MNLWNKLLQGEKFFLISGPCIIEDKTTVMRIAEKLVQITSELGIDLVFKASFDKANRTSISSFRGPGLDKGLDILDKVRREFSIPITTDIHEPYQIDKISEVVDIVQIPAFLSRQTDLLLSAANSGRIVNVKKGQFISPEDTKFIVEKIKSTGNEKILLTERGTAFGYNNLVVDFRAIPVMRNYSPVVFDATHSVQRPGGNMGISGGDREMIPYLARAAVAVGIDGLFMEVHVDPESSKSDKNTIFNINNLSELLKQLIEIHMMVQ